MTLPLLPRPPMPLLLLLSACNYATVCETVEVEVDDDDALGDLGVTLGELVASVEGVRSFPADAMDGARLTATLDLARGEGAAVFSDATWVTDRTQLESAFAHDFMLRVCDDRITVPLALSLTTADATFDIEGSARASSMSSAGEDPGGVGAIAVDHAVDLEVSTVPGTPTGDLAAGVLIIDGHLEQAHVTTNDAYLLYYPPVTP